MTYNYSGFSYANVIIPCDKRLIKMLSPNYNNLNIIEYQVKLLQPDYHCYLIKLCPSLVDICRKKTLQTFTSSFLLKFNH